MAIDEWEAANSRPWRPEWRHAAVAGPLTVWQQMSRAARRIIVALRDPDGFDAWAATIEGHTTQRGVMKPGDYVTLPPMAAADRGGIAFHRGLNLPHYLDNAGVWQPFGTNTGGTGITPPLEGHTVVVSASNSPDPSRADALFRCGGSDPDQDVVNAAIAYAGTHGGGSVRLLGGTYHCAAPIEMLWSNVVLCGVGTATVLQRAWNEPTAGNDNGLVWIKSANIRVEDMAIDGAGFGSGNVGSGNVGVRIPSGFPDVSLSRLDIRNHHQCGVFVGVDVGLGGSSNDRFTLSHSRLRGTLRYNTAQYNNAAIEFGGGDGFLCFGNSIEDGGLTLSSNDGKVIGNWFHSRNGGAAIWIPSSETILVLGNDFVMDTSQVVSDAGHPGEVFTAILFTGAFGARVIGNSIRVASKSFDAPAGIVASTTAGLVVSGNDLVDTGILFNGQNADLVCENNIVKTPYSYGIRVLDDNANLVRNRVDRPGRVVAASAIELSDGALFVNHCLLDGNITRGVPVTGFGVSIRATGSTGNRIHLHDHDGSGGGALLDQGTGTLVLTHGPYPPVVAGATEYIGSIKPWPGTGAAGFPPGWLLCNGQDYDPATYPELAAILIPTFGTLPGGNFRVPDLTLRTIRGATSGGEFGPGTIIPLDAEATNNGYDPHNHTVDVPPYDTGSSSATVVTQTVHDGTGAAISFSYDPSGHTHRIPGKGGFDTGMATNWPPHICMFWIIKAQNV